MAHEYFTVRASARQFNTNSQLTTISVTTYNTKFFRAAAKLEATNVQTLNIRLLATFMICNAYDAKAPRRQSHGTWHKTGKSSPCT